MATNREALLANLTAELDALTKDLEQVKAELADNDNAFFMCSMALIIFLMQCGFAFLEAGAVRSKNCTNILIKNVLDSLLAVIGYWAIGWALAYGPNESALSPLFGGSQFFAYGLDNYAKFFFQYVFAATAATIVSGAVAERVEFVTFITYSLYIASIVYPILTHWGWSEQGWMALGWTSGDIHVTYTDFAGSGMVHLCGGTISLIAAWMLGPRIGRFSNNGGPSVEIKGHSVPFAALGGFILMFGFLAFNGGSTSDISTPGVGQIVAKAMINTIMCGAFAALSYLVIHFMRKGKWTILLTINACLTGQVAACAGCNISSPWTTAITGTGAGLIYLAFSELALRMRIDDPLDAFAVHAGGGLWGLISVCLVSDKGLIYALLGGGPTLAEAGMLLAWNSLCALAIAAFSAVMLAPAFFILKKVKKFRVPAEVEIKGLDIFKHGEAAYPLTAYGHGWDEVEHIKDPTVRAEALRKISEHVDVSLEQLGEVAAKYSVSYNPVQYEHPEHHQLAAIKNPYRRNKSTSGATVFPVGGSNQ